MPDSLFTPVKVGSLELPNRIVMSAMTRSRAVSGGLAADLTAVYYTQRATAGLMVTGSINVSAEGTGFLGTEGLYTEAQLAAWRRVTDTVHANGGQIAAQLNHCGRLSHTSLHGGDQPPGVSAVPAAAPVFAYDDQGSPGQVTASAPRAMNTKQVRAVVDDFAAAAAAAQRAGFDAVEVQAANGLLTEQFFSPDVNTRDDAYGGSPANRARFLLEVAEAVTAAAPGLPAGVKLSPGGQVNDIPPYADWPEVHLHVITELNRRDIAYITLANQAATLGRGGYGTGFAARARAARSGLLVLGGGFDGVSAAAAIAEGRADLIAFGRPFLANPDLPARLRTGYPLAEPDLDKLYGGGADGYTDYPPMPAADLAR
jgi:2,4-dienoyl-CoA reductase-like NADH-dependent reductase (Old Yellow Enzyme family)